MEKSFKDALQARRTYYNITSSSPVSDEQIQEIIKFAVKHVPSAFNSQSTRIVLLLGEQHKKLWELTKGILKEIVPADAFKDTEAKIDNCFEAGHGTILFFEDKAVVEQLQAAFPSYSDRFPVWSQHTNAMHQLAIWTMLEDTGLGVSLQHYNPLIDDAVRKEWNLNPQWELVGQMPFGEQAGDPGEKEFAPLEERVKVFK